MRALIALATASLAALMLMSCASGRPAAPPPPPAPDSLAADSLGAAAIDDLFAEKYATLAATLAARASADPQLDTDALEARSLVAAAEEMYLYGKTLVAIRLLDEASTLLRRNR